MNDITILKTENGLFVINHHTDNENKYTTKQYAFTSLAQVVKFIKAHFAVEGEENNNNE